jgi:hypothetical protein
MNYQKLDNSSSWHPHHQDKNSPLASRPFAVQAQRDPHTPPTQEEIENEAFNQHKFEAFGLQLKQDKGTITPVEQERLGVLQAKMDNFWAQRQQRMHGNSNYLEIIARHGQPPQPTVPVQPKLTVGEANDKYEQEADRVAAQVVEQIHAPTQSQKTGVQRQELEEEEELQAKPEISRLQRMDLPEEEEELQTKPDPLQRQELEQDEEELQMSPTLQRMGTEGGEVSADLEEEINAARGSGQSLAPELQAQMGQAMGVDFSGVRVHTDDRADTLNRSVGARAFTTGQDLFFKRGEYQPGSRGGQELIAHELTHVVQQNAKVVRRSSISQHSSETNVIGAISVVGRQVLQRADDYFPNGDAEPHVHIHDGGITFTSVGHRHKNLVAGDQIRQAAVNEVINLLKEAGDNRSLSIVAWIEQNVAKSTEEAPSRIEELKSMLIEMGGLSEQENGQSVITLWDEEGNQINYSAWGSLDQLLIDHDDDIEKSYHYWQNFQNSGGQVLLGSRRELTEEDMSNKNEQILSKRLYN